MSNVRAKFNRKKQKQMSEKQLKRAFAMRKFFCNVELVLSVGFYVLYLLGIVGLIFFYYETYTSIMDGSKFFY